MARTKRAKGEPTSLNLYVLREFVRAHGEHAMPIRVDAVHAEHLRRCVRAGLVEQASADTARLTDAGRAALAAV